MIKKIGILGAGSFGIAIAKMLSSYENYEITLWSAVEKEIYNIKNNEENAKLLPGVKLNLNRIFLSYDVKDLSNLDYFVFAVSSKYVREVVKKVSSKIKKGAILINVAKGLEKETFKRLSEVIFEETKSENIVVLSGPSHAEEIAKFLPTTVVVASKNIYLAEKIQKMLSSSFFRVYVNEDVVGVEIAAALKNIIAIAVGICDGLNLGDNSKAALITRGLVEIARLGVFLGAKPTTFAGLAGVGDLIVTCTSLHSRNKKAGFLIGSGFKIEDALKKVNMTVEGYYATKIAYELSKLKKINMPIVEQLYRILYENEDIKNSIKNLMNREAKHEYEQFWFK